MRTVRKDGPLRIAYLTTLGPGGAERQMLILAEHLPRDLFEVSFLLLGDRVPMVDEVEAAGATVDVIGLPREECVPLRPRCIGAVAHALRRYRALTEAVDVVDAWLIPGMSFAAFAQPVAGVPVVVGGRRSLGDLYRSKPRYRRAAASIAARRMDAIVANSRAAAAEAIEQDRVRPERVHVIPNAVLPAQSHPGDRAHFRSRWGVSDGQLVVGSVANYKPEKGLERLVAAAAALRDRAPQLRFVLVGEGSARAQLEAEIERLGLGSIVLLHGHEPDARRAYPAFDIFVQASRTEGLPNAVLEAAAEGLPIVATAVGGTPEILTDERDGLLIHGDGAEDLADGIIGLADDAALRRRLGSAARERAADFSSAKFVDATAGLYLRLAGRRERQLSG